MHGIGIAHIEPAQRRRLAGKREPYARIAGIGTLRKSDGVRNAVSTPSFASSGTSEE